MFGLDLLSVFIGACLGIILMSILADKTNRAQKDRLAEEIETDRKNYLSAISAMESQVNGLEEELRTQKNVVKTLGENNQRLLKSNKELKKCKRPNDETIAYMVSLYGNWFDRSQEDYNLSPSDFIKKHWK